MKEQYEKRTVCLKNENYVIKILLFWLTSTICSVLNTLERRNLDPRNTETAKIWTEFCPAQMQKSKIARVLCIRIKQKVVLYKMVYLSLSKLAFERSCLQSELVRISDIHCILGTHFAFFSMGFI